MEHGSINSSNPFGQPANVTSLERTTLDVLRFPDRSGGGLEVLRIWKRAISGAKLEVLIDYANRFNQTLLRQRTGFLLEQLGVEHPVLDDWAKNSVRGSSARLIASREFSPTFSERCNLSINVPDSNRSLLPSALAREQLTGRRSLSICYENRRFAGSMRSNPRSTMSSVLWQPSTTNGGSASKRLRTSFLSKRLGRT